MTNEYQTIKEYNGWVNKPTRAVLLWINNDQGLQEKVLEAARNDKDDAHLLAGWLQDQFTLEFNPLADTATVYTDLLNWALAYVDWDCLAEHLIETIKETV